MTTRVITFVGESRRERVVFEGLEDDARDFVVQQFPRLHIEPGTHYGDDGPPADAVIDTDDQRKFFDGRNWQEWTAPALGTVSGGRTDQPDDRDDRIVELERQLANATSGVLATQVDKMLTERLAAQNASQPAPVSEPPAPLGAESLQITDAPDDGQHSA